MLWALRRAINTFLCYHGQVMFLMGCVKKKKSIALWLYQDAVLYKLFERMKMLRVDGPTLTENRTLVRFRRTPRDTRRPG